MAAGLEQRVPFLDVELMRFVERIPARARGCARARASGSTARRWRGCSRRESSTGRSTASSTPYDDWLRASLGEEVRAPLRARLAAGRAGRPGDGRARSSPSTARGRADHKAILYCLLELSEWHRAFVEAREPVPA